MDSNQLEEDTVTEITVGETGPETMTFVGIPRVPYELKEIETGKLKIRPQYQRPLNERRVEKMVRNYSDSLAGTLEVSFADGHYWVMDGQHRLAAMRVKGIRVCRALIHYGLSFEEEAGLFGKLNSERQAITPRLLYRAELLAGVERTMRVEATLHKYGLRIEWATGHGPRQIAAVGHLWELNELGVLDSTLKIMFGAWGNPEGDLAIGATEGRVIAAIGRFIKINNGNPGFALDRFQLVLSRHTPNELVREAQTFSTWARGSRGTLYRWFNYSRKFKIAEMK